MCTCVGEKELREQIFEADLIFEGVVLEKRSYRELALPALEAGIVLLVDVPDHLEVLRPRERVQVVFGHGPLTRRRGA